MNEMDGERTWDVSCFQLYSHWPSNRPRPPTGLSKSLALFFVSRFLSKKHWESASNSKILTRDKDQHKQSCQLFRLTSLHKSNHFDKSDFLSSDVTSFSIFQSTFFLEAQKQIIQHAYAVYWEIGNVERESACAPLKRERKSSHTKWAQRTASHHLITNSVWTF